VSKIKNAFKNKKAFIGFVTGGDPTIEKSEEFIMQMVRGGADLIEIGIPFSDPVAEGIVIQQANIRALKSGTTLNKVFSLVQSVRQKTNIPLVFLTYLNPVFNYGYEAFFAKCCQLGLDGIIIPDLPFEEKEEIKEITLKYDVDIISLIAPTSDERIEKIASESTGFLYIVSSMGVTGMRSIITTDIASMINAVKKTSTIPAAVGFGINTPQQASDIASIADGVIVGSAIVKIIAEHKENAGSYIYEYVRSMKDAIL
jgi:tryptophan synthase alpha chain